MKFVIYFLTFLLLMIPCVAFSLRINEVCSSNTSVIQDYYGLWSDWIELKNTTADTINLNLYCLSDSPTNLTKFRFPVGSTIAPGEIILVWAVNNVTPIIDPNGDYWGTNFAISANGEPVFLSLYYGPIIVDEMPDTIIPTNISYGRVGTELSWYFFPEPTPRAENPPSGVIILSPPIATQNSGWFAGSVIVDFTTSQTGTQIRFTTDGSEPTETDSIWTGPQTLYDRTSEPNLLCLIPTILPNLPEPVNELDWWFPPASNIPKIHTIKARCFASGALPSSTINRTYMVGINLYNFPIVSLYTDPDNLFDPDIGIYVPGNGYNGINFETANFMQNWDIPVSTDWFDPFGQLVYHKDCEAEIHGTYTARAGQKTLRLKGSEPTGPLSINYPFFGTDYLSEFRNLLLRNSGNDIHKSLLRDNLIQTIMAEQGLDVSKFQPYIVFLNGEYWGIHHLQEHMKEYYITNHYNLSLSDFDLIERNLEVNNGDALDYTALMTYLDQNDESDPAVWQYLETKIDMQNLCEYMAGEIIAGNTDWLGNNIRYWRKRVPYTPGAPYGHDGRWRWLVYDTDFSMGLYQSPYWEHDTLWFALDPAREWRTFLLRNIIQNEGFKYDFINTIADRLSSNWSTSNVISHINQLENQFIASMPMHINRWSMPANLSEWQTKVNVLRTFATNRPDFLRSLVVNQFGLPGTANLTLQINHPEGATIRMNDRVNLPSGDYV
ncbi:MAG: CotH kinase family protein, partial [Candidatus Cloacimonadaceae bacterium]